MKTIFVEYMKMSENQYKVASMEDNFVSKSCTGIVMFTDFFSIDRENLTLGFQYPETTTHLCFILALQLYGVTI